MNESMKYQLYEKQFILPFVKPKYNPYCQKLYTPCATAMSLNKMSCCWILKFLSLESILKGWSFGCTSIYPEVLKRAMRWD